jgi:hypothetical protein
MIPITSGEQIGMIKIQPIFALSQRVTYLGRPDS